MTPTSTDEQPVVFGQRTGDIPYQQVGRGIRPISLRAWEYSVGVFVHRRELGLIPRKDLLVLMRWPALSGLEVSDPQNGVSFSRSEFRRAPSELSPEGHSVYGPLTLKVPRILPWVFTTQESDRLLKQIQYTNLALVQEELDLKWARYVQRQRPEQD